MSAFDIAVEEVAEPQNWIEFTVGGKPCYALAQPTSGQIAYVTILLAKKKKDSEQVSTMLNFLDSLLDDNTQTYLLDLLINPKNTFGAEDLEKILESLMERWSGNPTQRPSDSMPPPPPTGPSSGPITPELTYSDSPVTGSVISSTSG
jgi:hypothetical protein